MASNVDVNVSQQQPPADGPACIPNIGPGQQRKRVIGGVVGFGVAAVAAGVMLAAGTPRPWRALLLLPFAGAAVGLFQVRAKTCVRLAASGKRNMDGGDEAITDPAELAQVRPQARRVYVEGILLAVALTAVLLVLPVRR